jgi:hypothetical protein
MYREKESKKYLTLQFTRGISVPLLPGFSWGDSAYKSLRVFALLECTEFLGRLIVTILKCLHFIPGQQYNLLLV